MPLHATICISREIQCLPYAYFFNVYFKKQIALMKKGGMLSYYLNFCRDTVFDQNSPVLTISEFRVDIPRVCAVSAFVVINPYLLGKLEG